jgi:hypothetical protein
MKWILVLTTCAVACAQQPVPLQFELPKPLFEGTPENLKVPNLEPPRKGPRAPFLAPAGTVNVARGRRVSSSTPDPTVGELSLVTDGDKSGADGSYVELGGGLQWVTIDLKSKHTIYAVLAWHYHKQPRVYNDIIVQIADDPDFISDVHTVFNNDHDNSAGLGIGPDKNYIDTAEGKLIDARGFEGRYLRLYSNGSNVNPANHYVEIEVYGRPAK